MLLRKTLFLTVVATLLIAADCVSADERFEKFSDVTYVTRGDDEILADVYVPMGDGPFPSVLMVHGGAWRIGSKWSMRGHARNLAKDGYTVVNINYRLAPKHKFPAQIDDCKEAVRWMRHSADKYKIDVKRIAGYGYSAGAHLVCLLGTTDASDGLEGEAVDAEKSDTRLQAVVGGGTPCDFTWIPRGGKSLVYWLGATRAEDPDVYRQASPISFVSKGDPPVFLFHGTDDKIVPFGSADRMVKRLKEMKVAVELLELSDKGHIPAFLDQTAKQRSLEFLNRVMKEEKISE